VGCVHEADIDTAIATCANDGARMCSIAELEGDCTAGSGCGHDSDMIWTGEPCEPCDSCVGDACEVCGTYPAVDCEGSWGEWGECSATCGEGTQVRSFSVSTAAHGGGAECVASNGDFDSQPCTVMECISSDYAWVVMGRFLVDETEVCASADEEHEVRCCSDTFIDNYQQMNGCAVWAESQFASVGVGSQGCVHSATLTESAGVCAADGARLCTQDESQDGCASGTGCAHDSDLIWTSTECVPPVIDCAGIADGLSETDMCGVCDDQPSNDCTQDCEGTWGGNVNLDMCGVCGGDDSTCWNAPPSQIELDVQAESVHRGAVYDTVRVKVYMPENVLNVYAMYGSQEHPLYVPPAHQHDFDDNSNIAGASAQQIEVVASNGLGDLQFEDSWITIGITSGDPGSLLGVDSTMATELENWNDDHVLVDQESGGAIFFMTPTDDAVSDDGTGVVVAQLVLLPGEYSMIFNMQGRLVQDPDGNDCTLPEFSTSDGCLWQAVQQEVVITAEVNDVCPYDSRPAVGSDGTCTPSSSQQGHDGCPDNFINAQDLLALLGQIATTLESEGSNFAGYPIDASPVPGCYSEAGGTVCYENYGDGFINVHDLLALLGMYGRDFVINPC